MTEKSQKKKSGKKGTGNQQNQKLELMAKIFGIIGTFAWIVGGVFELDSSVHNEISLWLFCFSVISYAISLAFVKPSTWIRSFCVMVVVFSVCIGIFLQHKWSRKDLETSIPFPVSNGDRISINAPENQGTVIGKQTNNFGIQPRQITVEQANQVINDLKAVPKNKVYFIIETNASDGLEYGNLISKILSSSGFTILKEAGSITGMPPLEGICVRSDPPPDTDVVDTIVAALNRAGLPAQKGFSNAAMGSWPTPLPAPLIVYIGKMKNP